MIEAKIIKDSMGPSFVRLTTFVLTYPRFIHSELMTHRVFSRNASSSRAIPVNKLVQAVIDNPAMPIEFRKNQKGMQACEPLEDQEAARKVWLKARDAAVLYAQKMADMGIHKQYVNRLLEPFAHISVVLTSTDFDNFFALRMHKDAQPELYVLAQQMHELYRGSEPNFLQKGEWHLPFITELDLEECKKATNTDKDVLDLLIKRSVAKCARVSYLNHEGRPTTIEEDVSLYDRLLAARPLHASPAEHQATPVEDPNFRSGNFRGWIQYRKTLPNEQVIDFEGFLKGQV